jgi:iron(II)-dependent oxidoreductase
LENEVSYEYKEKKQGVFTYFLVEGLQGKADQDGNGYVTVDESYIYVYQQVRGWASERKYNQTPHRETRAAGEIVLTITPEVFQSGSDVKPVTRTEVKIAAYDGAEMVLIPAGNFVMGSAPGEGDDDESPQHEVYLDGYYIDLHEVTNAQYKLFLDATGHPKPTFWDNPEFNHPNQPVVGVSWFDAQEYAKWVGRRLPTEAEWEKAARGNDRRTHVFGSKWLLPDQLPSATLPVGSSEQDISSYGVVDMGGNVAEWVSDFYGRRYYGSRAEWSNPTGPESSGFMKLKVIRGASWQDYSEEKSRCANRNHNMPSMRFNTLGFRLAMDENE